MKNRVLVVGLAAGLAGGAIAGLAWGMPGGASAQTGGAPASTVAPAAAPSSTPSGSAPVAPPPRASYEQHLKDTLAPLVKDGTITQAQADKIIAALEAAAPQRKGPGGMAPGGTGPGAMGPGMGGRMGRGIVGEGIDAAAKALGMTSADLRTELQAGKSLADVAKEKGVDVQKVVAALVAEAKTRLDAAVKDGKLTQAQADQWLAQAKTMLPNLVDGKLPAGFDGHGPWGHGPGDQDGGQGGAGQGGGQGATPPSTTIG